MNSARTGGTHTDAKDHRHRANLARRPTSDGLAFQGLLPHLLACKLLKYWRKPEEVFETVSATGLVPEYTLDLCRQDLEVLTEWDSAGDRSWTTWGNGFWAQVGEYVKRHLTYAGTDIMYGCFIAFRSRQDLATLRRQFPVVILWQ